MSDKPSKSWIDATEIVVGLILLDRLQADVVEPSSLYPGYKDILTSKASGLELDDIIIDAGISKVAASMAAAKAVNGEIEPLAWVSILDKLSKRAKVAATLAPKIESLRLGEDVDLEEIQAELAVLETDSSDVVSLADVEPTDNIWKKTGYRPIDYHLGGLPDASLTILAASPGIGKTTLAINVAISSTVKYPKDKVLIFTLEMTNGQICKRAIEIDERLSDSELRKNILTSEFSFNVNQVYATASQVAARESVSLVVVDYADLLVGGEQTEATMGVIYRTLQKLAKKINCPVLLVSQLNRSTYGGGVPRINHIRYSGMAEATAALILMAYNPFNILADFGKQVTLPVQEGKAYLIAGKSKYGFKRGGPGAIQIDWDGAFGWSQESVRSDWFPMS